MTDQTFKTVSADNLRALPDPLFLAPATHPKHGEGVVTSHYPDEDGKVRFLFSSESFPDGTSYRWLSPSTLKFHTPETPGGQPVDMEVETGHVAWGRIWLGDEIVQRTDLPEGTTVRRYVTDWEATP